MAFCFILYAILTLTAGCSGETYTSGQVEKLSTTAISDTNKNDNQESEEFTAIIKSAGEGEGAENQELWIQYQDGREMRLISSKPHEDPEKNITGIQNATFSTDKTKVYFMSDAWVTSSSIHVVDIKTKKEQYVCPGNSLKVLQSGSHKGKLIVNQHRYKKGGGSYDHYFLVDEQGTELKDLGEDLDEELMEQIEK